MFLPRLTAIISDIANDVETDKLKGLLNFFLFGYDVILFDSFPPLRSVSFSPSPINLFGF